MISLIVLGILRLYVYYYYCILLVYLILGLLVSNRLLLDSTIIIGNIINIYVLGLISIELIGFYFICILGWCWISIMWYYRVLGMDYFLCLLCWIELFAHVFQSLTLSNRICINIVAGCLFSYIIALLSSYNVGGFGLYYGINSYECINMVFQYGIFVFLIISLILW